MYTAKLKLNNKEFLGTLDFLTLKNIQKEFKKEFGEDIKIQDIFKKIADFDMRIIVIFILETTKKIENKTEEINELFLIEEDIEEKFKNIFEYVEEIFLECLPKMEKQESESEFEDEEEVEVDDWEFEWMEYMWTTTLKRSDFWNTTPRNFFGQMDIYKKINNVKSKDENIEEI